MNHRLRLDIPGLMIGTLFFAAALTPSLIPRGALLQGALAGICMAIGYGLGVALHALWRYLELPEPRGTLRRHLSAGVLVLCGGLALGFLWHAAGWQNAVRAAVAMAPVEGSHAPLVCVAALLTFAVILGLSRLFRAVARGLVRRAARFVPRRVAVVLGVGAALLLFWSVANDLLIRSAFRLLDGSYRQLDALIEPERPQPQEAWRTGSPASLVAWGDLGRAGREFVALAPSAEEIAAVTGRPALAPLRVYVGLPSAGDPEARAALALAELQRVGGFDRSRLVVITPTGTGWVDPAAMAAIEHLGDGDVASVALQYSYLSSPLSLLAEPEYGAEAARALFRAIYGHWTTLPKDSRPKLYLHGLSLGALNSQRSVELFEMLADPIDGAMWSGPPFESVPWKALTEARNPGTPEWRPAFRDGALVRFMNQDEGAPPQAPWGPLRIVYLQYASDPIVFFDYRDLYRRPAWMDPPRGHDVSDRLGWFPVVTLLQLALDMGFATTTPMGYGHVYAPEDYVNAWAAVAGHDDWSPEALERLKKTLGARARAAEEGDVARGG